VIVTEALKRVLQTSESDTILVVVAKANSEQSAESWETKVRLVAWSVKRIGSKDAVDVIVEPTLDHEGFPVSSPDTLSVSSPA